MNTRTIKNDDKFHVYKCLMKKNECRRGRYNVSSSCQSQIIKQR